jgi:hypothetical protein
MYIASAFDLLLMRLPEGLETTQGKQTKLSVCESDQS